MTNKSLYKKRLLQQRKLTDASYKKFLKYITLKTKAPKQINILTFHKYDKNIKLSLKQLHLLNTIRVKIYASDISYLDEIGYFQQTNKQLIYLINILTSLFKNENINTLDIYRLELLKESAGAERAYTYNQLLSSDISQIKLQKIETLIKEQEKIQENFTTETSIKDLVLYDALLNSELESHVYTLRKIIFLHNFNKKYAKEWFKISTQRINKIENISIKILNIYLENVMKINTDAKNALYFTIFLWFISLILFGVLTFFINKIMNQQKQVLQDLQIASYTFESHEAITITDPQGTILKVNKAFSKITGYLEYEAIGKNINLLNKKFYQTLWDDLLTNGYWSGEISNKRKNGEVYVEQLSITAIKNTEGIVTNYIAQFLDISELKEAQRQAVYQASHDFLTELPNRKSMMNKLQEENSKATRYHFLNAFLFIDLDGFKQVNDTYGHIIGDNLLIEVAHRLCASLREEDYVARMSGDEFAIILTNFDLDTEKAINGSTYISQKILEALNKPFFLDQFEIHIGASIGIKIFPDTKKSIKDIIHDADTAMYKAKENGKNKFILSEVNI